MTAKPLTGNQKAFLALYVRSDDPADHLAAYRDCRCEGWQGEDKVVKSRIARLVARPDADTVVRAERERRSIILRQQALKADVAVTETVLTAMEMRNQTLDALFDEMFRERARLEGDVSGKRSAAGFGKIASELLKATGSISADVGLTEAEAAALFEAKMKERETASAEVPVNPDVEARLLRHKDAGGGD